MYKTQVWSSLCLQVSYAGPLNVQDPRLVITVAADVLAPVGARTSAGKVMTTLTLLKADVDLLMSVDLKTNFRITKSYEILKLIKGW